MNQIPTLGVNPQPVVVRLLRGRLHQTVSDVVIRLARHHPEVVWCEPVPTARRLPRFQSLKLLSSEEAAGQPLSFPVQEWGPLDESRLGFTGPIAGGVHLVSTEFGSSRARECRVLAWLEDGPDQEQESPPVWWRILEGIPGVQTSDSVKLWRIPDETLLTMGVDDLERYGIRDPQVAAGRNLTLIRHATEDGRVILWRLSR